MTSSYNSITGTSSADELFGSTSADSIDALGGDDIVRNGGSENDIIALGAGKPSVTREEGKGRLPCSSSRVSARRTVAGLLLYQGHATPVSCD